jgi:hypothetical protein
VERAAAVRRTIAVLTVLGLGFLAAYLHPRDEPVAEATAPACPYGCPEVLESLVLAAKDDVPVSPMRRSSSCRSEPHVTIFYDDDERPLRAEQDRNCDGRTDVWEHYSAAGVVDRIEVDRDFDGTPDGAPAP